MAQSMVLSYVSCWVCRSKNLIDSCESSWNKDTKIGIGFVSSANTSRENPQNAFLNNPGFIDLNRTVSSARSVIYTHQLILAVYNSGKRNMWRILKIIRHIIKGNNIWEQLSRTQFFTRFEFPALFFVAV